MTASNPDKIWFVYMIETADGKLYTGISTDIERRFRDHTAGKSGARFFRTTSPVRVVWQEKQPNRSLATKREIAIKKLSRQQKLALIARPPAS